MADYKTVLFDLDGTLTDPGEGITNSVAYALEKNGISAPPREQLYVFIGPPLYESFQKYYGFSEELSVKAVQDYREYFADRGIFENIVYDGIPDLLSDLKKCGKTVILATSKPTVFAKQILEHFRLLQYFDGVYGSELDGSRIKKEDVIAYALEQSGISDLSHCVMVGDRKHDIMGANVNGMAAIGVLYGYGSSDELLKAGANATVSNVATLRRLLLLS